MHRVEPGEVAELGPLDGDGALVEQPLEVEATEVGALSEAVEVDVVEGDPAAAASRRWDGAAGS